MIDRRRHVGYRRSDSQRSQVSKSAARTWRRHYELMRAVPRRAEWQYVAFHGVPAELDGRYYALNRSGSALTSYSSFGELLFGFLVSCCSFGDARLPNRTEP